jgi:hypothetical protein
LDDLHGEEERHDQELYEDIREQEPIDHRLRAVQPNQSEGHRQEAQESARPAKRRRSQNNAETVRPSETPKWEANSDASKSRYVFRSRNAASGISRPSRPLPTRASRRVREPDRQGDEQSFDTADPGQQEEDRVRAQESRDEES